MTFTVKIALQPFEVAFEAGSIAEAVAILQEPDNELSKLAALATGVDQGATEEETTTAAAEVEKPKRGRKSKAVVEAVAPPPIPVPDAAPPAPPVPAVDTGIPAFLDRTAPVAVAPPPPPAPVAPPPVVSPPVVPPTDGPIAKRVIRVVETIRDKIENAKDGGAAYLQWLANPALGIEKGDTVEKRLVNWVASTGVITPAHDKPGSPTFRDLIDTLSFTSDDRLLSINETAKTIADALQIA